jgi:hypothetical protein
MPSRDDMQTWFDLNQIVVRYWADVNHNNGERAHEFYEKDGYFSVGEKRHSGRAAIQEFYQWRAKRGARIARHLITNVLTEPGANANEAFVTGSVCLYASDGAPILPSTPPTMVADFRAHCVRDAKGWLFRAHDVTPLFRGAGRLTSPPEHAAGQASRP